MHIRKSSVDEINLSRQGLTDYNEQKQPFISDPVRLDYTALDSDGNYIGGIIASIGYWGGLSIDVLFVEEQFRRTGIGKRLLSLVEDEGRKLGATVMLLDTFDFHAPDFYLNKGFEVYGELKDFPSAGKCRFFMRKTL
jgi:GNAT superfamily N-acetyltransferase